MRGPMLLALSALLLLLPLLLTPALAAEQQECFREIGLEEILQKVELPSCLAKGDGSDCSAMQHLRSLAANENKDVKSLVSRVTVLVLAHSSFAKEMTVPENPALEAEKITSRHLAFFAVTKCLKNENFCHRLRMSCSADTNHLVFLVSGHCSKAVRCVPIAPDREANHTDLLNMMDYLKFRMLERQLFVAKDLGEVQLGVSSTNEFLVQTEINDTHAESLQTTDRPLAVFTPRPTKHAGYYSLFSNFIDSALALKDSFAFHVVTVPLSEISQKDERPFYRKEIQKHEAFLALYSKSHCRGDAAWAFSCQPILATAERMLTSQQISGFLLHELLKQNSLDAPLPAFKDPTPFLSAFVKHSETYVISVMPVEEMLTDKHVDWEAVRILVSYLSSSFSVTYFPIILTKTTAIALLKNEQTGLNLEESLEIPCNLIRWPADAGFAILNFEEPVMMLDHVVNSVNKKIISFRLQIRESQEYLSAPEESTVPDHLTTTGHFAGKEGVFDSGEDVKDLIKDSTVKGRVDAFIEQLDFHEVYNLSGVLVVETNPQLVSDFFEKVGQDKPWLVVFVVSWSPLCKAARAIWSAVGQCVKDIGMHEVQLVKVDCFEANEICNKLNIQAYPTIAMYSKGKLVAQYRGPISIGDLCQFANLALQSPVLTTKSADESREVANKFLPLKSRVFVLEGEQPSEEFKQLAAELHPSELFIHQRLPGAEVRLVAMYRGMHPDTKTFKASVGSLEAMRDFVQNGHLDLVFPCSWSYLPQALARDKPLVVLFHVAERQRNQQLLERLHSEFSSRSSICTFDLHHAKHLSDVVQKLAGMSMPALVAIAKDPSGDKKIYRLALGPIDPAKLAAQAADWLSRALSHRLSDSSTAEPLPQWQPATTVYNFVDQVYLGKAAQHQDQQQNRSSRLLSSQKKDEATILEAEPSEKVSDEQSGVSHEEL